jgi:hypothetical protein
VQEIPGNTLLNASEHDLVQALVEEFRLDVPVLKENERYLAHSGEVQVDVPGDPRFAGWVRQGPVYRAGNENVILPCLSRAKRNSSKSSLTNCATRMSSTEIVGSLGAVIIRSCWIVSSEISTSQQLTP